MSQQAKMQKLTSCVKMVRDILRREGICDMDSMAHCVLFVGARMLNDSVGNLLNIDKRWCILLEHVKSKRIDEANQYKTNSQFGINLTKTMVEADIKNLGPPLNTFDNEYVPAISADDSMIIYTYKGSKSIGGLQNEKFKKDEHGVYYEDIYISKKINDSIWGEPASIGENINTNHNDASIALSPDGQELYIFYSDEKNGGDIDLYPKFNDNYYEQLK